MSRTVSLVDMSEKLLRASGILFPGFPKLADEMSSMAADLLIAAAETGELAMSELAGLREDGSGDRKAETPRVPATGRPPVRIVLPAGKAVAS